MTGAVRSHQASTPPPPLARLGLALAASALVHWMLLSPPPGDTPWQRKVSFPGAAPLTVRLAPVPAKPPDGPAERPLKRDPSSAAAQPAAEPSALPPAPDPHYYAARELDDYPRPLAPLRFDNPAGERRDEVRLELLIDEMGVVRDVIFVQPARPGRAEDGLRAELAATRFVAARKDGRAVRSRILLSLGPASREENPDPSAIR